MRKIRRCLLASMGAALLCSTSLLAAERVELSPRAPASGAPAIQRGGAAGGTRAAAFDDASVERGRSLLGQQCGFCHGPTGRGANGGPDLLRSAFVQEDPDGTALHKLLAVGRPDRGMPPFKFTAQQSRDVWTFLQSQIRSVAARREYRVLNILVGDAGRGKAYFDGPGKCAGCHSVTGDLKGIGATPPEELQNRLLNPRMGRGQPGVPAYAAKTAYQAVVHTPGGLVRGGLVRLTDFDVSVYDPQTRQVRTWLRNNGAPRVDLTNPLQAHVDLLYRIKDSEIHDLTAYLVEQK